MQWSRFLFRRFSLACFYYCRFPSPLARHHLLPPTVTCCDTCILIRVQWSRMCQLVQPAKRLWTMAGRVSMAPYTSMPSSEPVKMARLVPTPRLPINSVPLFLRTIGRGCEAHVDKFPTWSSLFLSDSEAMKGLGIGVRERKWILRWVSKYIVGITPYHIKASEKSIKKGKWKA